MCDQKTFEKTTTLLPLPKLRRPSDIFKGIADTSRRYNDLIRFAPNEPLSHKYSSEVYTARDTIDRVLGEAIKKIEREWCEIKSLSVGIETLVLQDDHWYERGNLLCTHR